MSSQCKGRRCLQESFHSWSGNKWNFLLYLRRIFYHNIIFKYPVHSYLQARVVNGFIHMIYNNLCFSAHVLTVVYVISTLSFERYYVPQTKFGRHIVFAPFLLLIIIIIIIIIIILSFFRQKFIRHISRRLRNGNQ